jgi:transmembrane sensor
MTRQSKVEHEALRRYVRSRAADFTVREQDELNTWLAADANHRTEYRRLEHTWGALDGLSAHLATLRTPPVRSPAPRWRIGGLMATALAIVLAISALPSAPNMQRIETAVGEQRVLKLPGGVDIALNADTAIDITQGENSRVDLLRGDIYVDVHGGGERKLEVRAAGAGIRDIGTRFAVTVAGQGGSVAVDQGMVELRSGTAYLLVRAGHSANYAAADGIREQPIAENAVAPWRNHRWLFKATPLSVLAAELARQQQIRVDIPEPAVAVLTVTGSFGFEESERMLWAAAEVHGLKLKRLGERHFQLQRQHATQQ